MTTPTPAQSVNNGSGDNGIVLLNTFVIWKKRYRVFYHSAVLVWEKNDTKTGKYMALLFFVSRSTHSICLEVRNGSNVILYRTFVRGDDENENSPKYYSYWYRFLQ